MSHIDKSTIEKNRDEMKKKCEKRNNRFFFCNFAILFRLYSK